MHRRKIAVLLGAYRLFKKFGNFSPAPLFLLMHILQMDKAINRGGVGELRNQVPNFRELPQKISSIVLKWFVKSLSK